MQPINPGQLQKQTDVLTTHGRLQDDLLDVLFWWRQIVSVVIGILWGCTAITGLYGFLM